MLWPFPTPPNPHLLGLLALKTVWKLNCTLKIIVMGGKWKHISIFFTWGSAASHDSRSFPGTMSGWLDFRVAPTYHGDNSQKNHGFLTPECSSKLSKRLPCRQLQLNCALVNSPWCPFFFLIPHEFKYLYSNSFRAFFCPQKQDGSRGGGGPCQNKSQFLASICDFYPLRD